MKTIIIVLVLFNISASLCMAQQLPNTIDEAKQVGEQVIQDAPQAIKNSSKEGVSFLHRAWDYIEGWGRVVWDKAYYCLGKQVEKRRPVAEKEFDKEVQELKQEVAEKAPSLWQRFKSLIFH